MAASGADRIDAAFRAAKAEDRAALVAYLKRPGGQSQFSNHLLAQFAASRFLDAANKMRELDVGFLPICGEDDRLKGTITDRDIVVKVLAGGKDPAATRAATTPAETKAAMAAMPARMASSSELMIGYPRHICTPAGMPTIADTMAVTHATSRPQGAPNRCAVIPRAPGR